MSKPSKLSKDSLRDRLADIDGFTQGYNLRKKIVQLGRKLRQLREEVLELSQQEAASLAGMSQSELSRIENGTGKQGPSWNKVAQIIEGYRAFLVDRNSHYDLDISVNVLVDGVEERHLNLMVDTPKLVK